MKQICLRITDEMFKDVTSAAYKEQMSRTDLIRAAIAGRIWVSTKIEKNAIGEINAKTKKR